MRIYARFTWNQKVWHGGFPGYLTASPTLSGLVERCKAHYPRMVADYVRGGL